MTFYSEQPIKSIRKARPCDDWFPLSDIDWEDYPWLIESFPIVADRMNITTARYEDAKEYYGRHWCRS